MGTDKLAVATDWFDAYRDQSLERILALYDDEATQACACGGRKLIAGKQALRAYWLDRFRTYPTGELIDVALDGPDAVSVRYAANGAIVQANLVIDRRGRIAHIVCGPLARDVARLVRATS